MVVDQMIKWLKDRPGYELRFAYVEETGCLSILGSVPGRDGQVRYNCKQVSSTVVESLMSTQSADHTVEQILLELDNAIMESSNK